MSDCITYVQERTAIFVLTVTAAWTVFGWLAGYYVGWVFGRRALKQEAGLVTHPEAP